MDNYEHWIARHTGTGDIYYITTENRFVLEASEALQAATGLPAGAFDIVHLYHPYPNSAIKIFPIP